MTNEQLFQLCQEYGAKAKEWRQKFLGLLPEVYKRRLYREKGFGSIFEFAAKLGGVSELQVNTVLHLDKKFEKTPELRKLLTSGEVSVHKLARIVTVAAPENQRYWASKIQSLPQASIEALVRDHIGCGKVLRAQELSTDDAKTQIWLSSEAAEKLLELEQKGFDISLLILDFLKERDERIKNQKILLANQARQTSSRHIPKQTKQLLVQEHGSKCAISTCRKTAEQIHHTQRFSIDKTHNPFYLAPLCKAHHRIAHAVDMKNDQMVKAGRFSP